MIYFENSVFFFLKKKKRRDEGKDECEGEDGSEDGSEGEGEGEGEAHIVNVLFVHISLSQFHFLAFISIVAHPSPSPSPPRLLLTHPSCNLRYKQSLIMTIIAI